MITRKTPLANKIDTLTQRLDHMVPDGSVTAEVNAAAARELELLSAALFELLPDKSLSPLERVERLARVVEPREPQLESLQPATQKLKALKKRIDDLVPGESAASDKILDLVNKLDGSVAPDQSNFATIAKLELLGDPRGKVEPT